VVSRRADDYVTKPFGLMELLARIDALAPRRTRTGTRGVAESVRFGAVTVYPATTV
jgi:DNA-binding response OmpR family regulator